jgi:hypothetical protein
LNKMQQGMIRIMVQYADGSPIEPEGVLLKWWNDCGVIAREKYKITLSWHDVVSKDVQEILWGFSKGHYVFPSEQEKIGKNAMLKQYLMHFGGSDMLSTSTICREAYHHWISLSISCQMNGTHSYNNIPLQKP